MARLALELLALAALLQSDPSGRIERSANRRRLGVLGVRGALLGRRRGRVCGGLRARLRGRVTRRLGARARALLQASELREQRLLGELHLLRQAPHPEGALDLARNAPDQSQ